MTKRETIHYLSADKKTSINGFIWYPEKEPRGVVQLIHGMAEFIERYDDFARYLTERGFLVTGHDHLGHGASITDKEQWGHFGDQATSDSLLEDIRTLQQQMIQRYPELPYFLLGHSMGSFLLRKYLTVATEPFAGAIIMGTGLQPTPLVNSGIALTKSLKLRYGPTHRSKLVDDLAFGGYNKKFEPAVTKKDWLTRDDEQVQRYLEDPRSQFIFTVHSYHELFKLISAVGKHKNIAKIPRELPLLLISGAADPVGHFGKDVRSYARRLVETGHRHLKIYLYEGYRHEILNERNNHTVYRDIALWLEEQTENS